MQSLFEMNFRFAHVILNLSHSAEGIRRGFFCKNHDSSFKFEENEQTRLKYMHAIVKRWMAISSVIT
jgi:hypothetical protein